MAKVTFNTKPVVYVGVVFNDKDEDKKYSTFHDFLCFLNNQGIFYASPWATTGSKGKKIKRPTYLGFHDAKDVTKIEAWLIERGGKRKN